MSTLEQKIETLHQLVPAPVVDYVTCPMSVFLRAAYNDFKELEGKAGYTIEMGKWLEATDCQCFVCFAGSFMHRSLGLSPIASDGTLQNGHRGHPGSRITNPTLIRRLGIASCLAIGNIESAYDDTMFPRHRVGDDLRWLRQKVYRTYGKSDEMNANWHAYMEQVIQLCEKSEAIGEVLDGSLQS